MTRKAHALAMLLLASALAIPPTFAADDAAKPPLKTGKAAEAGSDVPDIFKTERDRTPIQRDYVQQPPLIPHAIKGYNITKNFNKCMDCHSWSRYKETGATKVSLTHFKDRDGNELSNVAPRRYFCTQCHVPQTDAKPLVANTFKPVAGLTK